MEQGQAKIFLMSPWGNKSFIYKKHFNNSLLKHGRNHIFVNKNITKILWTRGFPEQAKF